MPDLLLELGCEELPASFVRKAYTDLENALKLRLNESGVEIGASSSLGTPRRLIIHIQDVSPRQPDSTKEVRGPGLKAAYDSEGNPTPALLGFCKSQGIDPQTLRKEGDYVWLTKSIVGLATEELLQTVLPEAIRSLQFEKSMRWGQARMRFARPIRWIVALFDGKVVPFDIEGVESSNLSRGHRFNFPDSFAVTGFDQLVSELRARMVEPDPAERRTKIVSEAKLVASGQPEMSEALIDENVFLTEWPKALEGEFKLEYMGLPEPVLVTAMAKHERFFPVRDATGKLTNKFVSIRNGGEDSAVRTGNSWVLSARFNDAKFFYDEDQKSSLDEFVAKTDRMLFQEKLGTIRQRCDRLKQLAERLASEMGLSDADQQIAAEAGFYAKADLSSGLVSELASLQGIIGSEYAANEGKSPKLVQALGAQYDLGKQSKEAPVGIAVCAADQFDKLAGYLGQGLAPTGSSDPYGLRRACAALIELEWLWGAPLKIASMLQFAVELYAAQGVQLSGEKCLEFAEDIFRTRYSAILSQVRYDHLEAALASSLGMSALEPESIRSRLSIIQELAANESFVQTATRPINIVAAAEKKGIVVQAAIVPPASLDSQQAVALQVAAVGFQPTVEGLLSLAGPINDFFDSTMVMVDDERIRDARLSLLATVRNCLSIGGDWTRIVFDGS